MKDAISGSKWKFPQSSWKEADLETKNENLELRDETGWAWREKSFLLDYGEEGSGMRGKDMPRELLLEAQRWEEFASGTGGRRVDGRKLAWGQPWAPELLFFVSVLPTDVTTVAAGLSYLWGVEVMVCAHPQDKGGDRKAGLPAGPQG